jgi:hypothetical protein
MLLEDIRQIFTDRGGDRIFSKTLVEALCGMTERPWPEARYGKPITETWLARQLKRFEISPRTIRAENNRLKGYYLAHFSDAFERYLPELDPNHA